MTITSSSNFLTLVWGSPNDNNPLATNTASVHSNANGTGLIGSTRTSIVTAVPEPSTWAMLDMGFAGL